jgi:ubiquinone biosynthesis protein COQ9
MSARLLQLALPLVRVHGFTRKTLSLSVLSLPTPHREPLSDSAVSSLFGNDDDARRTLVNYWLNDARLLMRRESIQSTSINSVLKKRLERNEEVLEYLPEVITSIWKVSLHRLG